VRADLLQLASAAVSMGAELVRTHRHGGLIAKGDRDMATELDFEIEHKLRAFLREHSPEVGFLGEEEGRTGAAGELMWALDPIDGTVNFVHGIPLCAVSLGLVHHGRSVLGVIDLPLLGMRYHAVDGAGAFANDVRIRCSRTATLAEAVVTVGDYAVGEGAERRNAVRLAVTGLLAARAQRVRMHGSAAIDLAWLAEGRTDAAITMSNKAWDMTAGVVIAREAGAHVVDRDGRPHTTRSTATIAAGPALLPEVLQLIHEATPGDDHL
jgi:myo-inositol-1(or 4)-monophosphatase